MKNLFRTVEFNCTEHVLTYIATECHRNEKKYMFQDVMAMAEIILSGLNKKTEISYVLDLNNCSEFLYEMFSKMKVPSHGTDDSSIGRFYPFQLNMSGGKVTYYSGGRTDYPPMGSEFIRQEPHGDWVAVQFHDEWNYIEALKSSLFSDDEKVKFFSRVINIVTPKFIDEMQMMRCVQVKLITEEYMRPIFVLDFIDLEDTFEMMYMIAVFAVINEYIAVSNEAFKETIYYVNFYGRCDIKYDNMVSLVEDTHVFLNNNPDISISTVNRFWKARDIKYK